MTLIPLAAAADPATCGGKAAQLARLTTAGLPVPDAIVIPATVPADRLDAACAAITAWANTTGVPHGLILRSSATGEDGPDASFAGLFTSCFTTCDHDAVRAALHRVRSSMDSVSVRAYADAHQLQAPAALAVIVQAAIRPRCAGVLTGHLADSGFTGWHIEAVRGLADPLVSGQAAGELHRVDQPPHPAAQTDIVLPATPDELQLPPGEWITLGDRDGRGVQAKIRTSAGALVTVWQPPAWQDEPILTDADRQRLLELATAAAKAIGVAAIDTEWAITGRGPSLLQARPLTRPVPAHPARSRPAPDTWQGIPASPGRASGPSLVLDHDWDPATRSSKRAVVVCGNLGPDAAAALLQRPAAIAATTGGPLSHAAIVARELGIPCVTALPKHLLTLPTGTLLTVDGLAGTVHTGPQKHDDPTANQIEITDAAVLSWPGQAGAEDGRAATIIVCDDGTDPALLLAEHSGPAVPVGVLRLGPRPLPSLPARYQAVRLSGAGWLGWPDDSGPVPPRLVVLDGTTPIWQRPLAVVASPRPPVES